MMFMLYRKFSKMIEFPVICAESSAESLQPIIMFCTKYPSLTIKVLFKNAHGTPGVNIVSS
eukprot:11569729-Ditylum_brightwellii.AAC.1